MREIKVISFSFQIFCTLGYCSIKLLDEEEIKDLKNEIIENGKYYRQSGTMLFEIEKENYSISVIWSVQDVKAVITEKFSMYNKKISDNDCINILDSIKKNHDAEIGINWLVIEDAIYQHIEQNKELSNLERLIDTYDYFDKDGYIIGNIENIKNLDEYSKKQLKIDFKECFYKVK